MKYAGRSYRHSGARMPIRQVYRGLFSLVVLTLGLSGCATHSPGSDGVGIDDVGSQAAQIAYQQVGLPYRFGGSSPSGFDCSGLVHYSYAMAGAAVPRTTGALWQSSRPVERDALRAGDLLFFDVNGKMSHVGMYIGDRRFVHAPSSGKTVTVASLDMPYYSQALIRAGRPR